MTPHSKQTKQKPKEEMRYIVTIEYIPRTEQTAGLYEAEHKLTEQIEQTINEWLKLHELPLTRKETYTSTTTVENGIKLDPPKRERRTIELNSEEFWKLGLPTVLYNILDGYDREAAETAAQVYLEQKGYTISKKGEEQEGSV